MPATTTTGSTNISSLDLTLIADLCQGKFFLDISDSVWIGSGEDNVLGANFQIKNPLGVIVKPYGSYYEIAPGLSGGMDAVISYNVPTQAGNYQYGSYEISVELFDADGTKYTNTKTVTLCEPDSLNKTRKYGTLSAKLTGVCKDGKLFVIVDGVPNYRGFQVESQVNDFELDYPTVSGITPLEDISVTSFSVVLYEGQYILEGTICALYNFGDDVFAKINYKVKKEHVVKCIIDLCCVAQQLEALNSRLTTDCTDAEKAETSNTIVEALFYVKLAELQADCGKDPSDSIAELEKLLGCSCTCNCNEGTPIIDLTPSRDVVIEGCNVEKVSTGLTDTYIINNYEYIVGINENGGAVTISAASTNGCVKTQSITFDISVVYAQIKAQVNNQTEYNIWAEFVNKTLTGLDATCIGLTAQQWAVLTFRERFNAVMQRFCVCCGCSAVVSEFAVGRAPFGGILVTWEENSQVDHVNIYLDGLLIATVLGGIKTYTFIGLEISTTSTFRITSFCSNGSQGNSLEETVDFGGKVYIVPPAVYTNHLVGTCPYNLETNVLPLPLGVNAEWHTANNPSAANLVADPTQAIQSTYYVFAKDSNNIYSTGVQVTLVCDTAGSCSAPQNLSVVPAFGGNLVQFQSAAYPPPLNSYTVKRRLKTDTDIPGNYTTIGTPVWNSSASRWQISDASAVSNTLYIYRAFSNCGGTSPYIDYEFASIICPTLTLTPWVTEINYSFVNSGGQIDKYEISVYEADGITLIHTDTKTPAFANPITGRFAYLDPSTTHFVGIKAYIGAYVKECVMINTTTLDDEATLTVDYIAGQWSAVLSGANPNNITLKPSISAIGSTVAGCGDTFETDALPSMVIVAGNLGASAQTDDLSYLSTYYHITNGLSIDGHGIINSGNTFTEGGQLITLVINHLSCSYYPA